MRQGKRRLIKHGGSVGITFPAKFLKSSQLKVGDYVGLTFDDILVIVKPVKPREELPDKEGE